MTLDTFSAALSSELYGLVISLDIAGTYTYALGNGATRTEPAVWVDDGTERPFDPTVSGVEVVITVPTPIADQLINSQAIATITANVQFIQWGSDSVLTACYQFYEAALNGHSWTLTYRPFLPENSAVGNLAQISIDVSRSIMLG